MPITKKIKKVSTYVPSTLYVIENLFASAGQTLFAMKVVSRFIFRSNEGIGTPILASIAIGSGLVKNSITIAPAIYRKFGPNKRRTHKDQDKSEELGWTAYLIYQGLRFSVLYSSLIVAINAHLGFMTLCEWIAGSVHSDLYDAIWKVALTEALAWRVAYSLFKKFMAYDYHYLRQNAELIAKNINERYFPWNKNTAKTLGISFFDIVSAGVLAYFWTSPALLKIPYAQALLTDLGISILVDITTLSAILSTVPILPIVYKYFNSDEQTNPTPNTPLKKSIVTAGIISGCLDSAAVFLITFVAVATTAQEKFNIDPNGMINILGTLCGLSNAAMNGLFGVYPGCLDFIRDIYERAPVSQESSIQEEAPRTTERTGLLKKEKTKFYGTMALTFSPKGKNETNRGGKTEAGMRDDSDEQIPLSMRPESI